MPTINQRRAPVLDAIDQLDYKNANEHYAKPYSLSKHFQGEYSLEGQELEDLIIRIRKAQYLKAMQAAKALYGRNNFRRSMEDKKNFPGDWTGMSPWANGRRM